MYSESSSNERVSYSINMFYQKYSVDNDDVYIFIDPKAIYRHESIRGPFCTTKPLLIKSGDHSVDSIDEYLVLKQGMVKHMLNEENENEKYFVIIVDHQVKLYTTEDGNTIDYHQSKLFKVSNPKSIATLDECKDKSSSVSDWNGII